MWSLKKNLRIGNNEINNIRIGNSDVDRIYIGERMIYPSYPLILQISNLDLDTNEYEESAGNELATYLGTIEYEGDLYPIYALDDGNSNTFGYFLIKNLPLHTYDDDYDDFDTFVSEFTGHNATYYQIDGMILYDDDSDNLMYDDAIIEHKRYYIITDVYNSGSYVDLDLPSGNLWAFRNMGANSGLTSFGNYYAWGETGTKSNYSWSTYRYGTSASNLTKYNSSDNKQLLELSDDVEWKYDKYLLFFQIPTLADWQELYNNTNKTWTTINGVNGYKFVSKVNSYMWIFLPAAGSKDGTSTINSGKGTYWTSTRYSTPSNAYAMYFDSSTCDWNRTGGRLLGFSIRGVYKPKQ